MNLINDCERVFGVNRQALELLVQKTTKRTSAVFIILDYERPDSTIVEIWRSTNATEEFILPSKKIYDILTSEITTCLSIITLIDLVSKKIFTSSKSVGEYCQLIDLDPIQLNSHQLWKKQLEETFLPAPAKSTRSRKNCCCEIL